MHLQEYTDCFANNVSVPGKTVREKSLIESEKNINNKIKNCTGRSGSEIIKVTKPKSAWGLISQGKNQNQPKKPNKKNPKIKPFSTHVLKICLSSNPPPTPSLRQTQISTSGFPPEVILKKMSFYQKFSTSLCIPYSEALPKSEPRNLSQTLCFP